MMTRQLELPEEVFGKLTSAAETEGITPAEWINARLPAEAELQPPDREILARYIGAFDSSKATPDPKYRTEFGDIIAQKLRRQGLDIP